MYEFPDILIVKLGNLSANLRMVRKGFDTADDPGNKFFSNVRDLLIPIILNDLLQID